MYRKWAIYFATVVALKIAAVKGSNSTNFIHNGTNINQTNTKRIHKTDKTKNIDLNHTFPSSHNKFPKAELINTTALKNITSFECYEEKVTKYCFTNFFGGQKKGKYSKRKPLIKKYCYEIFLTKKSPYGPLKRLSENHWSTDHDYYLSCKWMRKTLAEWRDISLFTEKRSALFKQRKQK